jgi:16S rRNA (guanine527-N7)-methyltransferase
VILAGRIADGAAHLEVELPAAAADALARYAELIARWNARIRVVGPGDVRTIVDEHVVDALGFSRIVRRAAAPAWYDIGAGAGLPGLVLACLFPDVRFVLVEPVGKKSAFMHHAATTLGLTNVEVLTTRIELLPAGGPAAALSRATFAPDEWFERARELVGPGGQVVVALGHADAPALRARAEAVDSYALPSNHARRTNLLLRA